MSTNRDDFAIAVRSALLQRGARQKFSLFALIIASILILILDNTQIKPVKALRGLLNDVVYRVSVISSSPLKFSSATKDFFINHIFLYKENEKLKLEIQGLKKEKLQNSFLETQVKQLEEIVEIDKDSSFTTVAAKLMLDKNSPYLNSAIINKGNNSGIKIGMPVLSKGYLVGRIIEVNFISSRILLLNDLNSRIPVTISPLGDQAILLGDGQSKPNLEYLPENFQLTEESTVYTSGKDGILFSGISVGEVVFEKDKYKVKLFSDPNQIFLVNVILDQATDLEAM